MRHTGGIIRLKRIQPPATDLRTLRVHGRVRKRPLSPRSLSVPFFCSGHRPYDWSIRKKLLCFDLIHFLFRLDSLRARK